MGKAKVLSTPKGEILKAIHADGGSFGISSRGLGTVNETTGEVNEDFRCITWDVVHTASNPSSKFVKGIYEGVEYDITGKPSVTFDIEKAMNEAKKLHKNQILSVLKSIARNL